MLMKTHYRFGEFKSMVFARRPGIHPRGFGHGGGHDTRSGLPLFRIGPKKVGPDHDLGLHDEFLRHHLSMVLLGIFAGVLRPRDERFHWRSQALRPDVHTWRAQSG